MIILIDNYDSFTYNLFQMLSELGAEVRVVRHDKITVQEIFQDKNIQGIVISPGPGEPKDAGITEDVIRACENKLPLLGICLGHQAIGEVFGGKIIRANKIMHGKISTIHHAQTGLYENVPSPCPVGRYHSLIIEKKSLPDCLEITAETEDGVVMGVRHKIFRNIEGLQFHPESILTPLSIGQTILKNFLSRIK